MGVMTGSGWCVVLTVVFVGAAVGYVAHLGGDANWSRTGVWVVHACAAAAMTVMVWPAGMAGSPLPYVLGFTACALFVVYAGVFEHAIVNWPYHAAMLTGMAAMPALMTVLTSTAAMPAMTGHAMAMGAPSPATVVSTAVPTWVLVSAATLAALSFGSAACWCYVAVRGPARPWPDVLMALGMGVSFALCM
jgi:Domain of unknown function (DUF5134)